MRRLGAVFAVLTIHAGALVGCGDDGAAAPDAQPIDRDAGPGDHRPDRIGVVNLYEGTGTIQSVWAELADAPLDLPVPEASVALGDCRVFIRPRPALCEGCQDGVCTAPDVCTPYPQRQSAGPITVTGTTRTLRFVPGEFGYVLEGDATEDLFRPGATITVSAPGAAAPAFAVELTAPPPLDRPFETFELSDNEDLVVTWPAPPAGRGRFELAFVVGWHGAPYEAMLFCETDDDGSLTVPGGLIAALPRQSSGLESHPSWLARIDRRVVLTPAGPIEVTVGTQVMVQFSRR